MTNDLNEKLKLVAIYIGGVVEVAWSIKSNDTLAWYGDEARIFRDKNNMPSVNCILIEQCRFHTSYDWQIPVWQKVIADAVNIETASQKEFNEWLNIRDSYINQICFGTPLDSFELLVQAIQFLKQIKNK